MPHFHFHNVNSAFPFLVEMFARYQDDPTLCRATSRNGDVIMCREPVTITYRNPRERVLFNAARDCNPFFHLFESLWMLAGRKDVEPLARYNSKISQYSDDRQTFNGAYGYRWRHSNVHELSLSVYQDDDGEEYNEEQMCLEPHDQLKILVEHLKKHPDSRRAVLQMWNVEDDLLKINRSKDVCCNVCAMFAIRPRGECSDRVQHWGKSGFLDMTVINRSNDMILGMLGANVVHFSVLQEYVAACLEVEVGEYHQITNNLHVYVDGFEPEKWLADTTPDWYSRVSPSTQLTPLVENPAVFDREVAEFIDCRDETRVWHEPFLNCVAAPMCWAFELHKRRDYKMALKAADLVESEDWRIAAIAWLERRRNKYNTAKETRA